MLLIAAPALGQAELPDAGLPDASVGGSAPDQKTEEQDSTTSDPCLTDHDCDRGFSCVNSRCTYRRYREATYDGCGANAIDGLWVLGATLLFVRRRYFFAKLTK